MNLPPFSGDHASCPKCAQPAPATKWRPGYEPAPEDPHPLTFRPLSDFGPERLRRTCTSCGHWWDEATIEVSP